MSGLDANQFITEYVFQTDRSKPGRTLDTVKVGEVYISRLTMDPFIVSGNLYHENTNVILFVTAGKVRFSFIHKETGKKRDIMMEPGERIIHWPPGVACASKNLVNEQSIVYFFSNRAFRSDDDHPFEVIPWDNPM